jgi:hypothetical protein
MKKFLVPYTNICTVYVTVEAETKEDAIEKGFEDAYVSSYVGNVGCDKLIGVYGNNVSIEAGESDFEDDNFGQILEIED